MKLEYTRGSIWYINLPGFDRSSVQRGFRPVVIVSSLAGNLSSDLVLVCPFTTKIKELSVNVTVKPITGDTPTQVLCSQITTVPKSALVNRVGGLDEIDMNKVDTGILIALGLAKPVVSKIQATQNALADAKRDREELEKMIPQAKELLAKIGELVKKVEGSNIQVGLKSKRIKRSPEVIKDFLREWSDPMSIKKDVAEAFGFPSYGAAANFYYSHSKRKVNKNGK